VPTVSSTQLGVCIVELHCVAIAATAAAVAWQDANLLLTAMYALVPTVSHWKRPCRWEVAVEVPLVVTELVALDVIVSDPELVPVDVELTDTEVETELDAVLLAVDVSVLEGLVTLHP